MGETSASRATSLIVTWRCWKSSIRWYQYHNMAGILRCMRACCGLTAWSETVLSVPQSPPQTGANEKGGTYASSAGSSSIAAQAALAGPRDGPGRRRRHGEQSSRSALPARAKRADTIKVGLITKDVTNPFFVKMKAGATAQAKKLGAQLIYAAGKNSSDNASQITAIENMVTAGVKGILITVADAKAENAGDREGEEGGRDRDRARLADRPDDAPSTRSSRPTTSTPAS